MLKTLFSRIMWLARGTSMVLGLAVMIALVFGVATMALAAVPGDPFKLGQRNSINKISSLVGSASSALLKVDNNGSGPALDLQVEQGSAPVTVNAKAGKATNLNADKVDGQNAPLLMRVNANGTLSSDDTVATITHSPNSGYYQFDFNRAVVGCVFQATLVNGPDGGEIAVYPSATITTRLAVITTANGTAFSSRYDRNFHLVLYC